jgi:uncharacterized protein YcnI
LIIIVLLISISIKVYANELTLDCPDSINPEAENTLEYVLKGKFTGNVNSIKVRYTLPDGVEFQGFTPSEGWNLEQGGTANTTGLILRINDNDVTGEVEFGKFTFNVPSTYNKDKIILKLFELDATNTSCELIDFDNDVVEKDIIISSTNDDKDKPTGDNPSDNNPTENNPSDNNPTGDNGNNGNEEHGNNESNTPTGTNDDGDKNGEESGNQNQEKDDDKNGNVGNSNTAGIGSQSSGAKNVDYNKGQEPTSENDTTVTKTPFGQYGNRNVIIVLIAIVSCTAFIVYKKLKKVKFIK